MSDPTPIPVLRPWVAEFDLPEITTEFAALIMSSEWPSAC